MSKTKKRRIYPGSVKPLGLRLIIISAIIFVLAAVALGVILFGSSDKNEGTAPQVPEGFLYVHFINVGQGDAILVETDICNMLIDTGNTDAESKDSLMEYLDERNITTIDYLVLTHPDEDHIGGAADVINRYNIDECVMPACVSNTPLYEEVLEALEKHKVDISVPEVGDVLNIGSATANILGPVSDDYSDVNDHSIVILLEFGATSFLFAADMGGRSELDFINSYKGKDLTCDLLKVGHHGASGSTSEEFLSMVSPSYAVISCGKDNKYGHPHDQTVEKLEKQGVEYYRTDISGTITAISNGRAVSIIEEK